MKKYWNKRFIDGGKIWGSYPSKTAVKAEEFFSKENINTLLVPGSGYGRNSEYFAKKGYKTTGLEIAKEAINFIPLDKKGSYYQGDVLDMSVLGDQLFDAIYSFNVFHLFRRQERELFIKECLNYLHHRGFIFLTVFSEEEPSFGKGNKVEENTFESKPGRPAHYFTDSDLRDYFRDFDIIDTGIIKEQENHGKQGLHTHILRFIYAQNK